MKIALFTETYLPHVNGVVTHIKSLKEGLELLGHEVLVVTSDNNTKEHYIKDGVLYCPGIVAKKFYDYSVSLPYSNERLKILKEFNPDIIHVHNEFGIGLFGISASKKLHVPLVYTLHTMYDDYLYYVFPKLLLKPAKYAADKYFKRFADSSAAITGPSQKVYNYLREIGVEKNISVIPNSVEIDIFNPENFTQEQKLEFRKKLNISQEKMLVCFCGRLGKEKSVDVLIDFWHQTVKKDDNMHLLIIGDGPSHDELAEQVKRLEMTDRVTFAGKILHKDIPPYYATCDAYITASLSEMYSISMLEGMASGLPVISRYDPENASQIQVGINGFIYHDANEMYSYLKKIRDMSDEQRLELKKSVRQSVENSGAADLANYLLEVYNSLTTENKPENEKEEAKIG